MAEHRYKAVVIDLFDTLVTWNPDGLPLMQFRGREIRSTTPLLYDTLETALGKGFDREKFSEAHASVYSEIFTERSKHDALEITCLERFARTLKILKVDEQHRRAARRKSAPHPHGARARGHQGAARANRRDEKNRRAPSRSASSPTSTIPKPAT